MKKKDPKDQDLVLTEGLILLVAGKDLDMGRMEEDQELVQIAEEVLNMDQMEDHCQQMAEEVQNMDQMENL